MIGVICGSMGIALSDPTNVVSLSISSFLIGTGSGVQLCTQPVASLFPQNVGMVLSSLSGAFQISGLIFLALTSNVNNRRQSFFIFSGCLFVLMMIAFFLYPKSKSFLLDDDGNTTNKDNDDDNDDDDDMQSNHNGSSHNSQSEHEDKEHSSRKETFTERWSSVSSHSSNVKQVQHTDNQSNAVPMGNLENKNENNNNDEEDPQDNNNHHHQQQQQQPQPLHHESAFQQMKTSEFILLCTWFSICIVPMQYYVGSIGFQLETLGDDDGFYTDLFAYTYAGATITAPVSGFVADKFGLGVVQGLATLFVAVSLFLLSAGQSIDLSIQSIGLVLYGIGRMAFFGIYFTNCGKRFGYVNYGTLAGLGLLISAIVSLLQYPLIALASDGYSSIVNLVLAIILIAQAPYFVWLYRRERLYESASSTSRRVQNND
jgi:hypothetical protein